MRNFWIAAGLVFAVGLALWPAEALACSCLAQGIYKSDPGGESDDVAINQAILIEGVFDPKSIRLENASGEAVPFTHTHGPTPGCPGTMSELIPTGGLVANTRYTVHVTPMHASSTKNSVSFTTGTRRLAERTLLPPKGQMSMVHGAPDRGGCGPVDYKTCITVDDFEDVEVLAVKDGMIIMRWLLLANDADFGFGVEPDCFELRRRSRTGARSEPLTFCGDARRLRDFRPSDMDGYRFLCSTGIIGRQDAPPRDPESRADFEPPSVAGSAALPGSAGIPAPTNPAETSSITGPKNPQPSAANEPKSRVYGCATTEAGSGSSIAWFALFACALVLRRRRIAAARG